MKLNFRKSLILILSALLSVFLLSCKNPFLANADGKYQVSFVTNCNTKIDSCRTDKIESMQELTKEGFEFDGWYTNSSFEGDSITFPYEVKSDLTLYAKWLNLDNFLTIDLNSASTFENNSEFYSYSNGIMTINPGKDKYIFKGASTNLCLKFADSWASKAHIVFDNFIFSSSESYPLIESPVALLIEYKGYNELSSSATNSISLINTPKTIEIKTKDNSSKFELKTNIVKNSTNGSIAILCKNVIINGGNLTIKGSNGWNDNTNGRNGGDGSSGIIASETVIKNNAVVTIMAGNGADGNKGIDGTPGNDGIIKGTWGEDSTNGETGNKGESGGNGGKGGTAIDGNLIVESCKDVTLSGGNGGEGGKGGKGGSGGKGGWCSLWGKKSRNGGNGGQGGAGGNGGDGGNAVSGSLINKDSTVYTMAGKHGNGGTGGEAGEAGAGGEHRGQGGGAGAPGNPGTSGKSGESGKDGVEHR